MEPVQADLDLDLDMRDADDAADADERDDLDREGDDDERAARADNDGDGDEEETEGERIARVRRRMPAVLPTIFPGPPSWATVFGRTAPLELELGFGRPHFLLERAAEMPAHDVVGIEVKGRWSKTVWRRQKREGPTSKTRNLCAIHGNAWLLAGALFAPGSLSTIFLNFPDPWWKTKHRKRRIVSDAFVSVLASLLAPGGTILIQTDVASLLEEYLERLEACSTLVNVHGAGRLAPRKPVGASSHREKKCRAAGIPIFRGIVTLRA